MSFSFSQLISLRFSASKKPVSTAVDFTIKATGFKLLFQWKKNGHVMGDNGKYIGAKTLTLQIVAVEESITIAW